MLEGGWRHLIPQRVDDRLLECAKAMSALSLVRQGCRRGRASAFIAYGLEAAESRSRTRDDRSSAWGIRNRSRVPGCSASFGDGKGPPGIAEVPSILATFAERLAGVGVVDGTRRGFPVLSQRASAGH
ncbi:MAG: hypothetical protein U5O39_19100 [Gammaproteobacteria bacterium]|nr:hypothetical protein [Gammaproteobacteria bacterium]